MKLPNFLTKSGLALCVAGSIMIDPPLAQGAWAWESYPLDGSSDTPLTVLPLFDSTKGTLYDVGFSFYTDGYVSGIARNFADPPLPEDPDPYWNSGEVSLKLNFTATLKTDPVSLSVTGAADNFSSVSLLSGH